MKKKLLIFSVFTSVLFFSCSDEEIITNEDVVIDLEVAIEQIEFTPETAQPDNRFNTTSEGLYHGVIVSLDTGFHGKIWANINNDGQYNATVVTNKGDRFRFLGRPTSRDNTKFYFIGKRGSFDYDVSNIDKPIATNVIIDSKEGHIASVKDRAGQRAAVILGTFQTNDDDPNATPPVEAINGTWDLITDGTPNPDAFNFPLLTEVVITVANNGNVYSDTDFETFDYPCFFNVNNIAPIFLHEDPIDTPDGRNEFWAQGQTAIVGAANLTYWLGQSSSIVAANAANGIDVSNFGFHNNDFANPPVNVCTGIEGQKGVWFWNGRSGFSSFDDPFDVQTKHTENVDYKGFKEMLKENK